MKKFITPAHPWEGSSPFCNYFLQETLDEHCRDLADQLGKSRAWKLRFFTVQRGSLIESTAEVEETSSSICSPTNLRQVDNVLNVLNGDVYVEWLLIYSLRKKQLLRLDISQLWLPLFLVQARSHFEVGRNTFQVIWWTRSASWLEVVHWSDWIWHQSVASKAWSPNRTSEESTRTVPLAGEAVDGCTVGWWLIIGQCRYLV